jgi:Hg(II)-responsive transcriptional regulator
VRSVGIADASIQTERAPCGGLWEKERAVPFKLVAGGHAHLVTRPLTLRTLCCVHGETMKGFTIGQLAKQAGVGAETIRFYERQGLIERPERQEPGYRRYPADAAARVRFIRRAKELGSSLKEISELLDLRMDPAVSCEGVRALAEAKRANIEGKIAALERMGEVLRRLVGACKTAGRTGKCPILEALEYQ